MSYNTQQDEINNPAKGQQPITRCRTLQTISFFYKYLIC